MIELRDCIYDEKGNYLEYYDLYDAHGDLVDRIWNYQQWLDVRVQIKENKDVGYYIVDKNGVQARIDSKGKWEFDKLDPYSVINNLLMRLI